VVDCWALNPDNLGEYMSLEHCRVAIERVCPRKGDVMVTNRRRPLALKPVARAFVRGAIY